MPPLCLGLGIHFLFIWAAIDVLRTWCQCLPFIWKPVCDRAATTAHLNREILTAHAYSEENGKFTLGLAVLHQQPKDNSHAERSSHLKALYLGLENFFAINFDPKTSTLADESYTVKNPTSLTKTPSQYTTPCTP